MKVVSSHKVADKGYVKTVKVSNGAISTSMYL